jgi:hypothetical protein
LHKLCCPFAVVFFVPEGPLKDEIAAREHQHLVSWKVDYLQDVDARGAPGDFFNGQLSVAVRTSEIQHRAGNPAITNPMN